MAAHRSSLLRKARHVDRAEALSFQVRSLAEHGRKRHHSGAAYSGDEYGIGLIEAWQRRFGQARQHIGNAAVADELPLLHLGPVHRDETRAKAIEAGEILVAGRLI